MTLTAEKTELLREAQELRKDALLALSKGFLLQWGGHLLLNRSLAERGKMLLKKGSAERKVSRTVEQMVDA